MLDVHNVIISRWRWMIKSEVMPQIVYIQIYSVVQFDDKNF